MDPHLLHQSQLLRYHLSKLQAYKSSFQAWKCVSFGYALLAMVLLLAKWHEVTTDLKLLTGIDQLIWAPSNGTQFNGSADPLLNSTFRVRSWPPVPLETLLLSAAGQMQPEPTGSGAAPNSSSTSLVDSLVAASEAVGSMDSAMAAADLEEGGGEGGSAPMSNTSSSSASPSRLMSHHMQMMVGRELSGGQLLRQEVEAFLAEFRSAKSTLSLSSLLVAVYIGSWILMTLAVNDARISNDVSLRNILVLSVFGAIDMAASCGFVMVRVIMFNVKNNNFVAQILGSAGLRESKVRLSADQLTAFTALRLIAMRSCSAYVDVYVSVLVALLTFLRLYAIIRAIAYYRFLRHFNDSNRNLHHQQQLAAAFHTGGANNRAAHEESKQQRHFVAYDNGAFRHESMGQPRTIWHHQQQLAEQQANMSSNPQTSNIFVQHVPHVGSARATPLQTFSMEPQVILTSPTGQTTTYVPSTQQAAQQTLRSVSMRPVASADYDQQQVGTSKQPLSARTIIIEPHTSQPLEAAMSAAANEPRNAHNSTNQHNRSPQLLLKTAHQPGKLPDHHPALAHHPISTRRQQQPQLHDSSTPNFLLVNGRPHRLVASGGRERKTRQRVADHPNPPPSDLSVGANSGFESEPEAQRSPATNDPNNNNNSTNDNNKNSKSDRQQPASFTLLSESQLNRLSRKLMANSSQSGPTNAPTSASPTIAAPNRHPLSKYKVLARYRPVKQGSSLIRSLSKRARTLSSAGGATELVTRTSAKRSGKHSLVDKLDHEHEFSCSSGGSSSSEDTSSSSASGAEGRPSGDQLIEVESDAGLALSHLLGAMRSHKANSVQTKSKRLSKRLAIGGTTRAVPKGLRHTEEYNLSAATARENRELLLRKYYYA